MRGGCCSIIHSASSTWLSVCLSVPETPGGLATFPVPCVSPEGRQCVLLRSLCRHGQAGRVRVGEGWAGQAIRPSAEGHRAPRGRKPARTQDPGGGKEGGALTLAAICVTRSPSAAAVVVIGVCLAAVFAAVVIRAINVSAHRRACSIHTTHSSPPPVQTDNTARRLLGGAWVAGHASLSSQPTAPCLQTTIPSVLRRSRQAHTHTHTQAPSQPNHSQAHTCCSRLRAQARDTRA